MMSGDTNHRRLMKAMRQEEYQRYLLDPKYTGTVVVLFYHFLGGEYYEFKHRFYYSKKQRLCFRYGAGLFEGMRPERLGQFEYDRDVAVSYVISGNYTPACRAEFFKKVLRIQRRHHARDLAKFVGGKYRKDKV